MVDIKSCVNYLLSILTPKVRHLLKNNLEKIPQTSLRNSFLHSGCVTQFVTRSTSVDLTVG